MGWLCSFWLPFIPLPLPGPALSAGALAPLPFFSLEAPASPDSWVWQKLVLCPWAGTTWHQASDRARPATPSHDCLNHLLPTSRMSHPDEE